MTTRLITVYGLVQGVGFRPFVYRLATELGLKGTVKNTGGIVEICITGETKASDEFVRRLFECNLEGSRITKIDNEKIEYQLFADFKIIGSNIIENKELPDIPCDMATCYKCREELFDEKNRRFMHPFISCVACGPRYSIIDEIPYDRKNIEMKHFDMCNKCSEEYGDALDRRCYAQTIACNDCGPVLKFNGKECNAIEYAVNAIKNGRIVAIKDIGGYHLACDAFNEETVQRLRNIKKREAKPFAVMFENIEAVRTYALVSEKEVGLISSSERPIVLLDRIKDFAEAVCKNSKKVGAMLPCNPVQILLMKKCGPLVMTSGNISGEPIIINDNIILELAQREDIDVLSHDRNILVPLDDSVVRVIDEKEQLIRRGRGYTPAPIKIKNKKNIFAAGGDLKASFCIASCGKAVMSQHFGDLENEDALSAYKKNIMHMERLYDFDPRIKVCDMHPVYFSHLSNGIEIQHHMAHVASVAAEHGIEGAFTGIAFDGTGYGTDGAIWGSEVFDFSENCIKRICHLDYVDILGGDMAAKDAKMLSKSYLYKAGIGNNSFEYEIIGKAIENHINTVKSSSMGRLFDAISAILDICSYNNYEGECAVMLENAASETKYAVNMELRENNGLWDTTSIIKKVYDYKKRGYSVEEISRGFHMAVINAVIEIAKKNNRKNVLLSGGVFMNEIITTICCDRLRSMGYNVYINEKVPTNDGGLALGQVYISEREYKICV